MLVDDPEKQVGRRCCLWTTLTTLRQGMLRSACACGNGANCSSVYLWVLWLQSLRVVVKDQDWGPNDKLLGMAEMPLREVRASSCLLQLSNRAPMQLPPHASASCTLAAHASRCNLRLLPSPRP